MRPWILAETNYTVTQDEPYEVAVLPNRTGYPRPGGLLEPDPVADAAVDLDVLPIRPQDRRDSAVQSGSQKTCRIGTDNLPHLVPV